MPAIVITGRMTAADLERIINDALAEATQNPSSAPFADGLAFSDAVEQAIESAVKAAGGSLDHASRVRIGTEAVIAWNRHHRVQGAA